jgi:hypothetical protein
MGDTFLEIDENMYAVPIGFLKWKNLNIALK